MDIIRCNNCGEAIDLENEIAIGCECCNLLHCERCAAARGFLGEHLPLTVKYRGIRIARRLAAEERFVAKSVLRR